MEKLIFQDIVESRLEKRTKGVYVPVGGKILIAFMDDFNMPMKEIYGSQPPLELIRQWIGYGFWCVSNPSANYFIVVEVSSLKLIKKKKKKGTIERSRRRCSSKSCNYWCRWARREVGGTLSRIGCWPSSTSSTWRSRPRNRSWGYTGQCCITTSANSTRRWRE